MLLTTIETLPEQKFTILGIARGNFGPCKNFGRDFMAGLKNLVGEMYEYTELMDETRRIATDRMIQDAERLGADAVNWYQLQLG